MIRHIRKTLYKYPVVQKSLVTILILSIYLLGTNITVPGVRGDHIINEFLVQVSQVTGGNTNSINLFTLGLGPYMSGMILWKLISMQKFIDVEKMSKSRMNTFQMIIVFIIALIQSLNVMLNIDIVKINDGMESLVKIVDIFTLIAGLFLLIWLCNINSIYGIGGMSIIILVNIINTVISQLMSLFLLNNYITLSIVLGLGVIIICLCIAMDKGEYRISLNRSGIDSNYKEKTYLPIKVNPSGGLSIMYALTLFAVPQYIVLFLSSLFQSNTLLTWLSQQMNIGTGFGLFIYSVIIFVLTIGFGFFNVDSEIIAEQLQKNGDYIENINPGKETQNYIHKRVLHLSIIGAVYVTCLSSLPLLYGVLTKSSSPLYFLPGSILVITGLLLVILEEINVLKTERKYKTVLDSILH